MAPTPSNGLHARASRCPSAPLDPKPMLHLRTTCSDTQEMSESLLMQAETLFEVARSTSFWRYGAGVAALVLSRFELDGSGDGGTRSSVSIHVYKSTLPIQKGLSSSAAVCVLVARAFNRLFGLHLSVQGEMELAYSGERLTGSLCGRMDQALAFDSSPSILHFDGEALHAKPLATSGQRAIHIVVADLGRSKDTTRILSALQQAYPLPRNNNGGLDLRIHEALGHKNQRIGNHVVHAIADGDAARLGSLMTEAQELFDQDVAPLCPDQLGAPRLHFVLAHPDVQRLSYGGKGVGSQGDGSVQLVARGWQEALELQQLLCEPNTLGCSTALVLSLGGDGVAPSSASQPTLELTLASNTQSSESNNDNATTNAATTVTTTTTTTRCHDRIRVAVIPAAGAGTRMFPASKVIRPKSLLPIVDPTDKRAKPLLLALVEECIACGIETVVLIVGSSGELGAVQHLFEPCPPSAYAKLKPEQQAYSNRIAQLASHIRYQVQEEPQGFGHAVLLAKEHVGEQPFVLLLGDVIFRSTHPSGTSCLQQMLDAYSTIDIRERAHSSLLGLQAVCADRVGLYGTVGGTAEQDRLIRISCMVEKPSIEQARQELRIQSTGAAAHDAHEWFLVTLGPYVLTPKIFSILERHRIEDKRSNGEIQLTPALCELIASDCDRMLGIVLNGEGLDIGVPHEYVSTFNKLSEPDLTASSPCNSS